MTTTTLTALEAAKKAMETYPIMAAGAMTVTKWHEFRKDALEKIYVALAEKKEEENER